MKVTNASGHSSLPPHLSLKVNHRNLATSLGGLQGPTVYGNVRADESIPLPVVPGTPKHNRNHRDRQNQGCICDLVSYWELPWPYFLATAGKVWEATAEEECLRRSYRGQHLQYPPIGAVNCEVSGYSEYPRRWDSDEEQAGTKHHTGW